MFARIVSFCSAAVLALGLFVAGSGGAHAQAAKPGVGENGVVVAKSAYGLDETVDRQRPGTAKGITFFMAVDQSKLAADAGIKLRPSTLLIFGNPGLGSHFMTANPVSGLDWPVRLLVFQDETGQVWTAYTDFTWIAQRHGITSREAEFRMASMVIASITSSVTAK